MLHYEIYFIWRTLKMSRAYGWRASCPAGGVTVVGVGSGAWFGFLDSGSKCDILEGWHTTN